MAGSPKYKVYNAQGHYVASCKHAEDAVILVLTAYPTNGTIRLGHGRVLFTAGRDGDAHSYDDCASIVWRRERDIHEAHYNLIHPRSDTAS